MGSKKPKLTTDLPEDFFASLNTGEEPATAQPPARSPLSSTVKTFMQPWDKAASSVSQIPIVGKSLSQMGEASKREVAELNQMREQAANPLDFILQKALIDAQSLPYGAANLGEQIVNAGLGGLNALGVPGIQPMDVAQYLKPDIAAQYPFAVEAGSGAGGALALGGLGRAIQPALGAAGRAIMSRLPAAAQRIPAIAAGIPGSKAAIGGIKTAAGAQAALTTANVGEQFKKTRMIDVMKAAEEAAGPATLFGLGGALMSGIPKYRTGKVGPSARKQAEETTSETVDAIFNEAQLIGGPVGGGMGPSYTPSPMLPGPQMPRITTAPPAFEQQVPRYPAYEPTLITPPPPQPPAGIQGLPGPATGPALLPDYGPQLITPPPRGPLITPPPGRGVTPEAELRTRQLELKHQQALEGEYTPSKIKRPDVALAAGTPTPPPVTGPAIAASAEPVPGVSAEPVISQSNPMRIVPQGERKTPAKLGKVERNGEWVDEKPQAGDIVKLDSKTYGIIDADGKWAYFSGGVKRPPGTYWRELSAKVAAEKPIEQKQLPLEAPPAPKALAAPEAAPPKAPEPTVTLYRAEGGPPPKKPLPDYIKNSPEYARTRSAQGRWFAESPEEAQWYLEQEHVGGKIVKVEIPASEAEQYRVSNLERKYGGKDIADNPAAFSARPDKEFFLPSELASKKVPHEPVTPEPLKGKVEITEPLTEVPELPVEQQPEHFQLLAEEKAFLESKGYDVAELDKREGAVWIRAQGPIKKGKRSFYMFNADPGFSMREYPNRVIEEQTDGLKAFLETARGGEMVRARNQLKKYEAEQVRRDWRKSLGYVRDWPQDAPFIKPELPQRLTTATNEQLNGLMEQYQDIVSGRESRNVEAILDDFEAVAAELDRRKSEQPAPIREQKPVSREQAKPFREPEPPPKLVVTDDWKSKPPEGYTPVEYEESALKQMEEAGDPLVGREAIRDQLVAHVKAGEEGKFKALFVKDMFDNTPEFLKGGSLYPTEKDPATGKLIHGPEYSAFKTTIAPAAARTAWEYLNNPTNKGVLLADLGFTAMWRIISDGSRQLLKDVKEWTPEDTERAAYNLQRVMGLSSDSDIMRRHRPDVHAEYWRYAGDVLYATEGVKALESIEEREAGLKAEGMDNQDILNSPDLDPLTYEQRRMLVNVNKSVFDMGVMFHEAYKDALETGQKDLAKFWADKYHDTTGNDPTAPGKKAWYEHEKARKALKVAKSNFYKMVVTGNWHIHTLHLADAVIVEPAYFGLGNSAKAAKLVATNDEIREWAFAGSKGSYTTAQREGSSLWVKKVSDPIEKKAIKISKSISFLAGQSPTGRSVGSDIARTIEGGILEDVKVANMRVASILRIAQDMGLDGKKLILSMIDKTIDPGIRREVYARQAMGLSETIGLEPYGTKNRLWIQRAPIMAAFENPFTQTLTRQTRLYTKLIEETIKAGQKGDWSTFKRKAGGVLWMQAMLIGMGGGTAGALMGLGGLGEIAAETLDPIDVIRMRKFFDSAALLSKMMGGRQIAHINLIDVPWLFGSYSQLQEMLEDVHKAPGKLAKGDYMGAGKPFLRLVGMAAGGLTIAGVTSVDRLLSYMQAVQRANAGKKNVTIRKRIIGGDVPIKTVKDVETNMIEEAFDAILPHYNAKEAVMASNARNAQSVKQHVVIFMNDQIGMVNRRINNLWESKLNLDKEDRVTSMDEITTEELEEILNDAKANQAEDKATEAREAKQG